MTTVPIICFFKDHVALYKSEVSEFIPEMEKPMTQAVDVLHASSLPASATASVTVSTAAVSPDTATASATVSTAAPPDNHNSSKAHDKNTVWTSCGTRKNILRQGLNIKSLWSLKMLYLLLTCKTFSCCRN